MTTDCLFDIRDRSVLIAGAAGGLASALARAMAERGARVILADLDLAAAEALAAELPGGRHAACRLDIRDESACGAAVACAAGATGRLDVIVNAAGLFQTAPATALPKETFEASLAVNVTGAFLLARTAGRTMIDQGGGRIISIASVSSQVANRDYAAYASSKAALAQLTRVLALEWAPHGVTVNAVGPAMTPTPLTTGHLADQRNRAYALDRIPMGRLGRPEDIVGAVILLASPAGAFITGQTIYVDGGRTLA